MQPRRQTRSASLRAAVGLAAATGLLAACVGTASPPTAAASAGPSTLAQPSPTATSSTATAVVETVAWGRIWDRVPSSFPLPADAEPAQPADPVEGPSSGAFGTGLGVEAAAQGIESALKGAGWSIEAVTSGEDGSRDISAVGANAACRSLVVVRPLGSLHFVTVYYGAGCPRP